MRNYSADRVKLTFTGIDLTPGLAAGSFITEAPVPPLWRVKGNGVGGIVYTYHPASGGMVNVAIDATSKEHFKLQLIYQSDRLTKSVVGALTCFDANNNETAVWTKARLLGRPPFTRSTTPGIEIWAFGYERGEIQTFDPDKNVVGA